MGKNKNGLVVSASVLAVLTIFFGIIGAILVVATAQYSNRSDCNYRPAAMPCGIMAAVLALMTQIVASAAMGCCGWCFERCPTPKSKGKLVLAVLLFILSWFLAVATVIIFLLAATMVGSRGYFQIDVGDANCNTPGVLIFVVATVLFKIVVGLDIVSYILF
ncbi:hypothetical protein VPH35_080927 [Triticum aestivum]